MDINHLCKPTKVLTINHLYTAYLDKNFDLRS